MQDYTSGISIGKIKKQSCLFFILLFCLCSIQSKSQTAYFEPSDTSGCAPLSLSFTNYSSNANSFYWDFGDGLNSTQTNPNHIFYGTGLYNVTLFAYDSMMNIDSFTIAIQVPANVPYFNLPAVACPGSNLEFAVFGNYDPTNVIFWDFGDGVNSNLSYSSHSYFNTGLYNAVLTVSNNSCGLVTDSNQILIDNSVLPLVHIHPDYGISTICPGENFPFFYDEKYLILWDFGDSNYSTDPYPIHTYDTAGLYNVSITVTNECGNTATLDTSLLVDPNNIPYAAIYTSNSSPCPNEPIRFSSFSAFGYTYNWDFGNGDIGFGQTVYHEFSDTGIYSIMLIVENECGNRDTDIVSISVTDTNTVNGWLLMENKELCPGGTIQFNATPGFSYYLWNFGDGDTSNSESSEHSYQDTGTFPIQLLIGNGCGNTKAFYDTIVVTNNLNPIANFEFSQNAYCLSDNIQFTNKSSSDASSFFWDFGDNNSDTVMNPIHKYLTDGVFPVKLIVYNDCGNTDSLIRTITINNTSFSVAEYTITPQQGTCLNQSIAFDNLASDTSDVLWYFGDGDSSTLVNATHQYQSTGNYFTELHITNGCSKTSSTTKLITISNSFQLEAPILSCSTSNDSILFEWNSIENAVSYEVSQDGGSNWFSTLGDETEFGILGVYDSTYSLVVRAIGSANCYFGKTSISSSCIIIPQDIINSETEDYFEIFPNPSSEAFTILIKAPLQQTFRYYILDIRGKLVLKGSSKDKQVTIDMGACESGIYFANIVSGGKSTYKKLIFYR